MTPETPDPPPVSPDPWKAVRAFAPVSPTGMQFPRLYDADAVDAARAADALRHQQEIADLSAQVEDAELRYRVTYTSLCDQAAQAVALRAALSTAEDTPRMAERTDRQAQVDPWAQYDELKGMPWNSGLGILQSVDAARAADAALLRERDAQIAKLQEWNDAQRVSIQEFRAERDAAQQENQTLREALEGIRDKGCWPCKQRAIAALSASPRPQEPQP